VGGSGPTTGEQPFSSLQSVLHSLPSLLSMTRRESIMRDPLSAIEIEPTDVFGVLQHWIDRVRTPNTACVLQIEPLRDCLLAESLAVQLKDLAHDRAFYGVKGDAVADWGWPTACISSISIVDWLGAIAVGLAARREAVWQSREL
jgi:hypothetical protein